MAAIKVSGSTRPPDSRRLTIFSRSSKLWCLYIKHPKSFVYNFWGAVQFGDSEDTIDINTLLKVASSKDFRDEIYQLVSHHLNKEHFTIAIGVEGDELIFMCLKQFDDDESFNHLASIMT